jgi:GrpB-like predicted nucleotidyltransferase (UPF0157 family)
VRAPVVIVDYDARWPAMYEEERQRVLNATGELIVAIEHIGSTAVPGLGAKPIIDLMAAVRRLTDAEECIEPLESVGYEYVPEYNKIMPERRYFHKGPPERRTHHLHIVELTGDFWTRHLLFRDYLRAHPKEAQKYYRLKKDLSAKYHTDREGYTEAKSSFIESVISKAQAETAKGLR